MREHHDVLVRWIGAAKLAKGILLVALGLGAFALLKPEYAAHAHEWIDHGNDHMRELFTKVDGDDHKLVELGAGSLLYAALFLVEGYALLRTRVWGEYLTIVITTSFIPFEIYELLHGKSVTKSIVLIANIAIVAYLVARRWHARAQPARHHFEPARHMIGRWPKADSGTFRTTGRR